MKLFPTTPIPDFYNPEAVGSYWKVDYAARSGAAGQWAAEHSLQPAARDDFKLGLLLIDVQNTFCLPEFELFVAGRSGRGAVEDNQRLCEFIYRNLGRITRIAATMDTHLAGQIFHPVFLVDEHGQHPEPYTLVSAEDVRQGRWKVNPELAASLGRSQEAADRYLQYYTDQLSQIGKYDLTIWPYHAMLGGIGHALVSAVEEAIFFHTVARVSQADFIQKGMQPWTEAYSAIGPEILEDPSGTRLAEKNRQIINWLQNLDALAIAGQAKSHCVAWTVADLLKQIQEEAPKLASRVYLLEDCTSPVVIPGAVDYTEQADQAFERFASAGMHVVSAAQPVESWPGIQAAD
jgi:nicotinamidase-related amidase